MESAYCHGGKSGVTSFYVIQQFLIQMIDIWDDKGDFIQETKLMNKDIFYRLISF